MIPNKVKRTRTAFTTNQILALEDIYKQQLYVSKSEREALGEQLGLTERAIKVWFQNRRMKGKKSTDELESSYNECTPNIYDDIEEVVTEINNCPMQNDYVHINPTIIDKLGKILHESLPSDLNLGDVIEQPAEVPNNGNDIESQIINSSENLDNGIDIEDKYYSNQDVNESEQSSASETIDSAEVSFVEIPKRDILQKLFDKHFC